jgi:UDPglucose 6-dehydrogenase
MSKKNIAVIGSGYVGLVSALCFADSGHFVTSIDNNIDKINLLKKAVPTIYEPGLKKLLEKNIASGNITFTSSYLEGLRNKDVCFIAVGTPNDPKTNKADLSFLFAALDTILENVSNDILIVNKSTIPLGTTTKIKEKILAKKTKFNISLASNPEFLSQGRAIKDFLYPQRIIIGVSSSQDENLLAEIYASFTNQTSPLIATDIASAELIKYAANTMLALRVAYINEIAQIAAKTGANIQDISTALALDERIGSKFLQSGPGYGGSCFPKDTISLAKSAKELDLELPLISNINLSNNNTINIIAQKIITLLEKYKIKNLLVMGLAFKAGTDDIRDSQPLKIIDYITNNSKNIQINVHDPFALKYFTESKDITKSNDLVESIKNNEAIVIATEWKEYQEIPSEYFAGKLVIDLRAIMQKLKNQENYYQLGVNF